jgi:hypothetical protein
MLNNAGCARKNPGTESRRPAHGNALNNKIRLRCIPGLPKLASCFRSELIMAAGLLRQFAAF